MTKEELTRIKQAYYSGLKVQIWFNGYWENFDARDYSMYSDPFSENRQYRIIGSDYADIAEKHIAELEKENAELKTVKIPQLERKIASIRGAHSVDCKKLNARLEQCERQKERIADLEKEISVLLSCQNCPENKGGLICQKEYENKYLSQKIQYIKELKEENAELEKENAELKARLNAINLLTPELEKSSKLKKQQLTKAKEIILKLYNAGRDVLMCRNEELAYTRLDNAINDKRIEQFLKEVSE